MLSLERLRGIQWIPGDGQPTPDQWLPLLKRIRDGGKRVQVFVSPEGARRIVVLGAGRIVGDGSVADLLRTCPAFGQLFAEQLSPLASPGETVAGSLSGG